MDIEFASDGSQWRPVRRGDKIIAYVEVFADSRQQHASIPGASRWIDGGTLDLTKARPLQ